MKWEPALGLGPAIVAAIQPVVKVVPVPFNFADTIRVPTSIACFVILVSPFKPKTQRQAVVLALAGAICLGLYYLLVPFLLYGNDGQAFKPGQYAAIGLWPTPYMHREMARRGWTAEQARTHRSPRDWQLYYDLTSQTATATILLAIYAASFCLLTFGFKGLLEPAAARSP
ncbi:MAG TPA: hypothetical protein VHS78_19960 [Candidatus Elarobacter sp.]|jgi:predicted secreted protein|nr:hypothetical protein [Candidatus Elarobacter sp.]